MSYMTEYKSKLIRADDAAAMVKSGDRIELYGYMSAGNAFDAALAKRTPELENITIRTMTSLRHWATFASDPEGKVYINESPFFGTYDRAQVKPQNQVASPALFNEYPMLWRNGDWHADFGSIQVSPPDDNGYMYFTFSPAYAKAISEGVKCFIPEVNENHFPTKNFHPDARIHVSEVPYIIEGPNWEHVDLPVGSASEVDQKIAAYITAEVEDGCCLQFGTGGVPNAVINLMADSDLKNLGIHTELFSDGMMQLAKKGRITGSNKALDKGLISYSMCTGTLECYDYLKESDMMNPAPCDYINDPHHLEQMDKFVAVNACMEIDLQGQVNSESIGTRPFSGTGGQFDFLYGAYRSKGGKGIVCCPSTHKKKDGTLASRIKTVLPPGATCTDLRATTQYVCTEYGIVNLKGRNLWERAELLISIAHPDFREELYKEAEQCGLWRRSNKR